MTGSLLFIFLFFFVLLIPFLHRCNFVVQSKKDLSGNCIIGDNVYLYDTHNCVIHTMNHQRVVVQGLENYIVAEEDGKLLICRLNDEQRIRQFSGED